MRCRRGICFLLVCRIFLSQPLLGQAGRSLHPFQHKPSETGERYVKRILRAGGGV